MAARLQPGDLDRRVTLQRNGATYATTWAGISPLGGRELLMAQQVSIEATTMIRMRYRTDVQAEDLVVYGTTVYQVNNVNDVESGHQELQLMCKVVQ